MAKAHSQQFRQPMQIKLISLELTTLQSIKGRLAKVLVLTIKCKQETRLRLAQLLIMLITRLVAISLKVAQIKASQRGIKNRCKRNSSTSTSLCKTHTMGSKS